MDEQKVASIASRVVEDDDANESDKALTNVDAAVDIMIAALKTLDENLPQVKPENTPQQAALDNIKEALDQGVKPYFADVVKDLTFFD
jgi:predicted RNase H-like HicB family nuclease